MYIDMCLHILYRMMTIGTIKPVMMGINIVHTAYTYTTYTQESLYLYIHIHIHTYTYLHLIDWWPLVPLNPWWWVYTSYILLSYLWLGLYNPLLLWFFSCPLWSLNSINICIYIFIFIYFVYICTYVDTQISVCICIINYHYYVIMYIYTPEKSSWGSPWVMGGPDHIPDDDDVYLEMLQGGYPISAQIMYNEGCMLNIHFYAYKCEYV
jgi:hypothetical protein